MASSLCIADLNWCYFRFKWTWESRQNNSVSFLNPICSNPYFQVTLLPLFILYILITHIYVQKVCCNCSTGVLQIQYLQFSFSFFSPTINSTQLFDFIPMTTVKWILSTNFSAILLIVPAQWHHSSKYPSNTLFFSLGLSTKRSVSVFSHNNTIRCSYRKHY